MAITNAERLQIPTYKYGRMDKATTPDQKLHDLPNYPMPTKASALAAVASANAHHDIMSIGPVRARATALYGLFNDRRVGASKPIAAPAMDSAAQVSKAV